MVWGSCVFSIKSYILILILIPAYSKAQTLSKAKKQDKRLVIKESNSVNNFNPNYKQSRNEIRNTKTLTMSTEKDSAFEDDNYKHRPHNKSVDRIIIKQVVDKKDENYKHQFPLGK